MAATATRTLAPKPLPAPPPKSTKTTAPAPQARPTRTRAAVSRRLGPAVRLGATAAASPASRLPAASGGQPLAPAVQTAIEDSLQVDMQDVRVHSDSRAQNATRDLSARAFTEGNNIVLGAGESAADLPLMAHEAAHVVQQQGGATIQHYTPGGGDSYEREANQASEAVARGETFQVQQRTQPRVQRWGVKDVLDKFAELANLIPGFRMFTIVLGVNPINMSSVPRTAANVLRAVVELIPFGGLISQALDNYGIFDKIGNWVDQQISSLGMTGSAIKAAVTEFIDSLKLSDILDLDGVWERAKRIFTAPIRQIIDFASGLVSGIIDFIKDAILMPLAKLAEGTPGWELLIAVLGKNPITGEAVPQTADNLIGPFMKLIGQEEVWQNIKKANALARAWAWFKGALSGLLSFVEQVPALFISTLKSLEIMDIVLLPRAFIKVATVFGSFLGKFLSWAGDTVWDLLKIIFEVVAPGAMPYLKKVGASLKSILKNPIGFVGNLVKAGKLGFQNFANNIGAHLKAAFLDWLTGSLPGVYIPKSFAVLEIVKLGLSVLGISWANIRQKLVKATSENIVKGLEAGFEIVKKLVTEGPTAAWEEIKSQLANLKDMVVQGIMDYIVETVVKKAIAKVLSLLVPGGAFIQAIISIYDTIMVFIAKLSKIIQVAMAFLDSIMAIASGAIGGAAAKVERVLAGLLTLAISFLAGFLGLGKIADKVMNIINTKVRAPVDKALDFVVNWIVGLAKKAGKLLLKAVQGKDDRTPEQKQADLDKAVRELRPKLEPLLRKGISRPVLAARLFLWKRQYKLTSLTIEGTGIIAAINPTAKAYDILEKNIGAALEPILQRAEARYLKNQASVRSLTAASNQRFERAAAAVGSGQVAPERLTQTEMVRLLRGVQQGTVPTQLTQTGKQQYPRQVITAPGTQDYTLQVSDRSKQGQAPGVSTLQDAYVKEAGSYLYSRDENSPLTVPPLPEGGRPRPLPVNVALRAGENLEAIRGLRDEVEVARHLGNLPANRVAQALVNIGAASGEEATIGKLGGMATGYSAEAGSFGGVRRGSQKQIQDATTVRQGSYAAIFQRLRDTLNQPNNQLLTAQGGASLEALAKAFDQWLTTALDAEGKPVDSDQAKKAERNLQARLIIFLRNSTQQQ